MKKFYLISGIFLSALMLTCEQGCADKTEKIAAPSNVGEKISYAIRKMNVKAGNATLVFNGPAKLDTRDTMLITFTADGLNFFDEEKIYVDPKTYFPVRVQRDINIWGKKEKITEDYFPGEGRVNITKVAGGKTTQSEIKKPGNIDNIYAFIFRYRRSGTFKLGEELLLKLPTQDVKLKLEEITDIKAADRNYSAFFMKSDPPKYQVWFDASDKKIPLRINGAVGFGSTAMMMTEYQEK